MGRCCVVSCVSARSAGRTALSRAGTYPQSNRFCRLLFLFSAAVGIFLSSCCLVLFFLPFRPMFRRVVSVESCRLDRLHPLFGICGILACRAAAVLHTPVDKTFPLLLLLSLACDFCSSLFFALHPQTVYRAVTAALGWYDSPQILLCFDRFQFSFAIISLSRKSWFVCQKSHSSASTTSRVMYRAFLRSALFQARARVSYACCTPRFR